MVKERIPISGDLKSKVKQLMEYAGWYEGRKVDISIAEQYYAAHGVPMMKPTQRFYRKYFGLCCEWYLEQKKMNWAADFQFALFPYLVNGIKNHLEEAYFRDMSGCELAEIEQAAGEKCQPIGHIGYYYPAEVWISEHGKLYAKYEYQDEIECFPNVFALIERELRFRDMSGCELAEIEQAAGEKCQPIGHIGYYYPAEVWISEHGKLYAKYEYQDEIECFPNVFALIERELRQCKFDSAAMKTVEALDGKI